MADEEEAGDVVVSTDGMVIQWEDMTETVEGTPVAISGYEVIITKVEHDDPYGFSCPITMYTCPPIATARPCPPNSLSRARCTNSKSWPWRKRQPDPHGGHVLHGGVALWPDLK